MRAALDDIDASIIGLLQKNGRMPNTEIAKHIGISEATVRKHLQRLISEEIIQIVAVGNPIKLGFEIAGTMKLKLDLKQTDHVIDELKKIKEFWYIGRVTGAFDVDLEFTVTSHEKLRQVVDRVNGIKGVLENETAFLLQYVRNRYDWGTEVERSKAAKQPK